MDCRPSPPLALLIKLGLIVSLLAQVVLPVHVSAQVSPPGSISAVSFWASPLDPARSLDPFDPDVAANIDKVLIFTATTFGEPLDAPAFEDFVQGVLASLVGGATPNFMEPVDVPSLGLGSMGFTGTSESVQYDLLANYDERFIYLSMALSGADQPSELPMLQDIAAQLFSPARAPAHSELVQAFMSGYRAERPGASIQMLDTVPRPDEVPPEYQLLDFEVILD